MIRFLAPGDFKTIQKRLAFYQEHDLSHKKIIEQLEAEVKAKTTYPRKWAIGFQAV